MAGLFDIPDLPGLWGDAEDIDTRMVSDRMRRNQAYENSIFGRIANWLSGQQEGLEGASAFNPISIALEGAQIANRWAGSPAYPERVETGDVLAPLGLAGMAAPFLRARPTVISSTLGSRNASIFDPPEVPKRPFSEDYPSGARADDTGRLTHDIEGRPLTAETVVGRRVVGGDDEAFPAAQLDAFTEAATGRPPQIVAGNTISGEAGRLIKDTDRRSGNRAYAVLIDKGLPPQQAVRVLSHENAHVIDEIAGQIPTEGLTKELGQVYHDLNDASWRRGKPTKPSLQTTPASFGYSAKSTPRELMAEAVRAYLTNPNYLKSVAPKTAARIRKFVNENEELARVIQFNADQSISSLPGTVINAEDDEWTPRGLFR